MTLVALICCVLVNLILFSECAVLPSIPAHLLDCYRTGAPNLNAPRRLDVYLSLIKKIERNSPLDLRLLSTAVLKSLRLDGIEQTSANAAQTEFVLPYRASAFQFHKYKLLMDLFLPSQNLIDIDEILTLDEKCLLHKMLSSAVRQWERGDESDVCPVSAEQTQNMATASSIRIHSRCPIEEGVVQTDWGTISPGTLMAAIAASLESQRVLVTDILNANIFKEDVAEPLMTNAAQEWFIDIETLDLDTDKQSQVEVADIGNVWVATLAGDLAEVVVNQGPRVGADPGRMIVGSNSRWNDTLLPRRHYLFPHNSSLVDWHVTDAEILAGIDGLILAEHVPKWVEQRRSLRLSQIIEMYYSNEGVSFYPDIKACNREQLYMNLFNNTDTLFTETMRLSHVLSLRQITVYIPVFEIERMAMAAVQAFSNYVSTLLKLSHKTCQVSHNVPVIDLVVATDGSWRGYDVEQFMSWIGGALDINKRSTISLLQGNTGAWISPPVNNLTTLFSHISNFTDEWPSRLNMPTIMSTILQHSQNKSLREIEDQSSAGISTVVLILSPTDRPTGAEMEMVRDLMALLRKSYFDVYFAYVATELTDFQNINNEYLDYSELFIPTSSTNVADIIVTVDTFLVKSTIPKRIFGAQCPFNGTEFNQTMYEDYVIPNLQTSYRIHPFYLRGQSLIQVQFRNDGQGQLMVCMWRGADESHTCQTIPERGLHTFNLTKPCPSADFCPPAHFIASAVSSANLCAHNDCSYPNQVGYYLRHSGLRCLPLQGSGTSLFVSSLQNVILTLLFITYMII